MAETKIEYTVVINRPIAEVFAFISKADNMPRWAKYITEAAQTSEGPVDVGTTCYVVSKMMGLQVKQDFTVTECIPDRVYAARSTSGPVPMESRYVLEEASGATEVHVSTTTDLSGVMKMAGPLLTRKLRKQMREDHENLKRYLESEMAAG